MHSVTTAQRTWMTMRHHSRAQRNQRPQRGRSVSTAHLDDDVARLAGGLGAGDGLHADHLACGRAGQGAAQGRVRQTGVSHSGAGGSRAAAPRGQGRVAEAGEAEGTARNGAKTRRLAGSGQRHTIVLRAPPSQRTLARAAMEQNKAHKPMD